MRLIKNSMLFLWGAVVASSIWALVVFDNMFSDAPNWVALPLIILIISFIVIVIVFGTYLTEHWDEG